MSATSARSFGSALSTAAATAAVRRLSALPPDRMHVSIEPGGAADRYTVSAKDGVLRIEATGAGAAVAGYSAFVRETGVGYVGRFGTRPADGAIPEGIVVSRTARVPHRVAYNICVGGYTTPFFDWAQWEEEVDLLAASGVTSAHLTLGQELVLLETFTRLGYSESEVLAWIAPPSHQPWMWLNNIQHHGRGTTRGLVERRAELARRVIARMLELDITPILPGFSGTVPPGFTDRNPGAATVPQGKWFMDVAGPERPDWLSSTTPAYADVAQRFYAEQKRLFGHHGMWAVDLLHEGGKPGPYDIGDAARGVQTALRRADEQALWVLQAWGGNPQRALLDAIDLDRVLVLDLTGEAIEQPGGFREAPSAVGILPNYGGRTVLYGDLRAVGALPETAFGRSGEHRDPVGLTNMAEGVANNPVLWDLFSDVAWTQDAIDVDAWLGAWVQARYGSTDGDLLHVWHVLLDTCYGPWRHDRSGSIPAETARALQDRPVDAADGGSREGTTTTIFDLAADDEHDMSVFQFYASTDSVIAAIPSLRANQSSNVGPRALAYDPRDLVPALTSMIASESVTSTPGYEYDLVDIARQVVEDAARTVLQRIDEAATARDLVEFDEQVREFLEIIEALDALLSTNRHFLLGAWTTDAAAWGSSPDEAKYLAMEAARLLTTWGYRDSVVLTDYANRSWAGLVGEYYRLRWTTWFDQVRESLSSRPTTPVDWYALADEWLQALPSTAAEPHGEPRNEARRILDVVSRIYGH